MSIIRSYQHGWGLLGVIVLTGFVAGCSSIPKEAYRLPQSSLSEREAQTRTFDVSDDSKIFQASVALLQDMEYNIDAIEQPLGALSASKVVDADSALQKAGLVAADVAAPGRSYAMSRCVRWGAMVLCVVFAGCASTPPNVTGSGSQLEARQIQTRDYDTLNKRMTLRSTSRRLPIRRRIRISLLRSIKPCS